MNSLKAAISKSGLAGRLNRRRFAVALSALVLGLTVAAEAAAQPATKQGYGPNRGDDRRGIDHRGDDHRPSRFSPPAPVASPARNRMAPSYRFQDNDRIRLQRYYQGSFRDVRIDRRPHFGVGQPIPRAYRPHIAVVPLQLRRELAPPPRGYRMGYYQGYSVVYDPVTFTILSVLDLLTH